jgi:hypothetical protein
MSKETEGKSKVYDCQVKRMDMRNGLFLAAEDYRSRQKFVQEMVQKDPKHILIFTASSPQKDVNTMRRDFTTIMQTVKVD